MDGHLVDVAVIATRFEEFGHPGEAIGSRGGHGAAEGIALVGEGPEVLLPHADCGVRIGSGLGVFVDPMGRRINPTERAQMEPNLRTR